MWYRIIVFHLLSILNAAVFAQYTYFNQLYLSDQTESTISSKAFTIGSQLYTFGTTIADSDFHFSFRHLSVDGIIENEYLTTIIDTAVYASLPEQSAKYDDGFAWCGTYTTGSTNNIGAAIWFSLETFQPIWSHTFNEINDSSNKSVMDCIRKVSDGTFYVGGARWTYFNGEPGVSEFSTYIAHLDENGATIEDWMIFEDVDYYHIYDMFELENGKLLISGMRSHYQFKDQFLLLFNTETGQIEQEEVWGSDWIESRIALRKMPDGEFYCIYDTVLESDGEFLYPIETKQCRLRKLNTEDLSYDWDVAIPLLDLIQNECRGFGVLDFEATLDNGYVFNYNYQPVLMLPGAVKTKFVKLDSNYETEWTKEYFLPITEYEGKSILDLCIAPDGGFFCSGLASLPEQRQWTFKTDACGEIEMSDCPAVSVSKFVTADQGIQVSPNPFQTLLKAILPQNAILVLISDATGRVVFEEKVFYPNQQWNLSGLSDGVYVMSVELENGIRVSQRIVKN